MLARVSGLFGFELGIVFRFLGEYISCVASFFITIVTCLIIIILLFNT